MEFETFLGERLPALLRFATVLTGDQHLGEDLVQEVLIRAHPRWAEISGLELPEGYLRRMIVNEYLSWRRKWSRVVPRAAVRPDDVVPDPAAVVTDRADVAQRLARLPARHRAALVLRFYYGYSDADVAVALDCRPGTARSYISRGLAALRIHLDTDTGPPAFGVAARSAHVLPGEL